VDVLLKSSSAPIDHDSYKAVELLEDIWARWATARHLRELAQCSTQNESPVCAAMRVPEAEIHAVDASLPQLKEKAEFDYLNPQPTSFVLPTNAVDRLRAAARTISAASPEFQRLLKDAGAKVVTRSVHAPPATAP
jgi:NTE family protein